MVSSILLMPHGLASRLPSQGSEWFSKLHDRVIVEGFGEDLFPVALHILNLYNPQVKRQWFQNDSYEHSELEREHLSPISASGFPEEKSILLQLCTVCVLRTRYLEKSTNGRYCLI